MRQGNLNIFIFRPMHWGLRGRRGLLAGRDFLLPRYLPQELPGICPHRTWRLGEVMRPMASEPHEGCQIRCPKLGSEVTFAYCLAEQGELPCSRVIRCWRGRFAVETYLKETLSPDEWNACFNQIPQDKVTTLVELIEAAKQRRDSSPNS